MTNISEASTEQEFDEPPEPQMDWAQVALNGGPPCFAFTVGDTHFCGRAERWDGHGIIHEYISLRDHINECADSAFRVKEILRDATRTVSPTVGWQPIETVPKDGSEILLGHANSIWIDEWIIDAEYEVGGYWMMCDQWSDPEIPTHWMRLPSPPQIALKPSSP